MTLKKIKAYAKDIASDSLILYKLETKIYVRFQHFSSSFYMRLLRTQETTLRLSVYSLFLLYIAFTMPQPFLFSLGGVLPRRTF